MMQAQIRLLKEAWVALDTAARQRIIEGKQNVVDETVAAFLHSLGTPQTPQRLAQGT